MSEKKPFNDVIKTLETSSAMLSGKNWKIYKQAIRVLKAAGKVDKARGLKFIHSCGYPIFPYPQNMRQVRALLESLPGKEEE